MTYGILIPLYLKILTLCTAPLANPLLPHSVSPHSVYYKVNVRLTFLLYNGKAVPISLFRRTKGRANHVFQRGSDFQQESDVRQNSCLCRKGRHFGRPSEGILSTHGLKVIKIHFILGTRIINFLH